MDAEVSSNRTLARGELQLVEDYYQWIPYHWKDAALERRMQPVKVDEPTVEKKPSPSSGHPEKYGTTSTIQTEAVAAAILSNRYIQGPSCQTRPLICWMKRV